VRIGDGYFYDVEADNLLKLNLLNIAERRSICD